MKMMGMMGRAGMHGMGARDDGGRRGRMPGGQGQL